MWSEILIVTCSLAAMVPLWYESGRGHVTVKSLLSITLASILLIFLPHIREHIPTDWGMIIGITSLLISLAVIIHYLKPVHLRFPVAFSFTPAVIILFYPLIEGAYILKELLNQLLQGGALFIGAMLYPTLHKKLRYSFILLSGLILLLAAYVIYWFTGIGQLNGWIWHLCLAGGLVVTAFGIRQILGLMSPERREP